MERLILIFTFISIFVANLQSQWEVLNEGYYGHINDIDFVSDQVGWLISYENQGWLAKTMDGGESWQNVQLPENIYFNKIDFSSDSVGWAFGSPGPDWDENHIYKTTDGGLSWRTVYKLPVADIWDYDISAFNDSVVYTLNNAVILKTTDGGENWYDISINLYEIYPNEIQLIGSDAAIVLARNGSLSIFRTTNGGVSWDETILPGLSVSEDDRAYDLQVVNDSLVYFLALKNAGTNYFLYSSSDTGRTWTPMAQRSKIIHAYFVTNENTIFALMEDSVGYNPFRDVNVFKSIDGGLSWENGQSFLNCCSGIYFIKNNDGFIINNTGRYISTYSLFKSPDLGKTWDLNFFNYSLNDIYVFDRNGGFASGNFVTGIHDHIQVGDLYFTNDGGKTWESKFNLSGSLKKVFLINETIGFGVGSTWRSSTFIKTMDGGNTWAELNEIADFVAKDMSFLNEQTGWIAGKVNEISQDSSSAGILLTKDGGETWKHVWQSKTKVSSYSYGLKSSHIVNSVVWAVGEGGLIVKLVNPDSFQVIATETDLPLNDVWFSDENHGWIAGGYSNDQGFQSILLKTINAGQTWSVTRFDKYLINDMHFADSLHGWAVGNDTSYTRIGGYFYNSNHGIILETHDGGDNWNTQVKDLSAPLNALHFKDGVGWAVGDNGLVLRTDDGTTWIDQNTCEMYPSEHSLSQNYPNPFNAISNFEFGISNFGHVNLSIYNLLGQKVATLVDKKQTAGRYTVQWDASGFASGIYFYILHAGDYSQTKKMLLLR